MADDYKYKKFPTSLKAGEYQDTVRDDRPFVDRLTHNRENRPEGTREYSMRGDVELPNKGKKDPRLSGPLDGLKKAAEGYKLAKKKGIF